MFHPAQVPAVSSDERLARFVIFSKHFRPSNNTIKPDAFIPHPLSELSMTRHREATETEIWQEGERVAKIRSATLYGRGDVDVQSFNNENLQVVAKPIPENPNHADVMGWPVEKSAQKMKAMEIAARAAFVVKTT